ncbi:MAG: BTAD domain-containing putative transcriptional regulator [Acidimicrobiia bacterium]
MEFRLLGPLEVVDDTGQLVEIRGAKLRTLLGALVLKAGQPLSSDHLADVMWGDSPPGAAANALQAQISKLRRILVAADGTSPLETRDGGYVLLVEPSAIDAHHFATLAALGRAHLEAGLPAEAAKALRDAIGLWRGPALADFVYDDFAETERVRLDEVRLAAIEDRVDADLALGNHDAVIAEIEVLVSESPLRERFWGQLMLALYRAGRQADALRAFQRVKERLAEDLGLDPGPELRRLEQQILVHDPSLAAPTSSASRPPLLSNVRPEISSFVGRDVELEELSAAIRARRLVTVTGPGGVGKTRLAVEAAVRTQDQWRDGTWLVELGPWSGAAAVGDAFAKTFGPRLGTSMAGRTAVERVEEWLIDGLSSAQLLVVLDNCEHVLGDAARIAHALARGCTGVHVLATSREALGAPGETVRPLGPLGIDDAVALFASRAADSSSFVLDVDSAPAVERICSRVDRLPLAIELTAARTRAFSAPQLAELIHRQFGLVSSASATRPARQQTLDAAVAWSYELLSEDERRLLMRLSVFAGGFPLDAASAVCADEHLAAADIGVVLARLVDKSLVAADGPSASGDRFRLLRSVADFATARLEEGADVAVVRDRHLGWLLELTAGVTAGLRGPDHLRWAHRVNAELPNLARGGNWALQGGNVAKGLGIGVNLGWFAFLSANVLDDEPVLLDLLDLADEVPADLRCRAMMWGGLLSIGRTGARSWAMDAIDVARTAATSATNHPPVRLDRHGLTLSMDAVELARTVADPSLLLDALVLAALHLAGDGWDPDATLALTAEARPISVALGDDWSGAMVTAIDGLAVYAAGDLHEAVRLLEEAVASLRRLGDAGTAALFEISVSEVAELYGDIALASSAMERALEHAQAAGFQSSMILRAVLTWLTARNGELTRALELGRQAVAAAHQPFNPVIRAQALFALGVAEWRSGLDDLAGGHLDEAFAIHQQFRMKRELAMDHTYVGYLASRAGDPAAALEHHRNAVASAAEVGLPWTVMLTACGLAEALVDEGHGELGCGVLGMIEAISERHDYPLTPEERSQVDATRNRARNLLGESVARGAELAGAQSTIDDMVARATRTALTSR